MSHNIPRAGRVGAPVVALAALLALFLSFLGLSAPAGAANNDKITVTNMKLVKSSRLGADQPGATLMRWDIARLSFDWDASDANVASGDSFTINLGSYFQNWNVAETTTMTVEFAGEKYEIGTCALTKTDITCTFTDKVDELRAAGFGGFRGSGSALVQAMTLTSSATADITAQGTSSVDLPGDGGIETPPFNLWHMWKSGSRLDANQTGMDWYVGFGSDYIQNALADGASPIVVDGTTRSTIVFTDTLAEGMTFSPDMSRWVLHRISSQSDPISKEETLTTAAGGDANVDKYGDFDMNVSVSGQTATITITGPFAPKTNYQFKYPVTIDSGTAVINTAYKNTIALNDSSRTSDGSNSFVESLRVSVEMAPGYGSLYLRKEVTGSGAAAVPANVTYPVTVTYILPAKASAFIGWNAPGTLSSDEINGSVIVEVSGDGTYVGLPGDGTFPAGTKVFISEDTAGLPGGFNWGTPLISPSGEDGSEGSLELIIRDRVRKDVTVTNTATAAGTFSVAKNVTGEEGAVNAAATKDYTFTYTCSDGSSGEIANVKGDGVAVPVGQDFPIGTTCTVEEDADSASISGYTVTVPETQTVTITTESQTVTMTNDYSKNGTPSNPTPSASAQPKPTLARTGADSALPVGIAAAALAGGALLVRRRQA